MDEKLRVAERGKVGALERLGFSTAVNVTCGILALAALPWIPTTLVVVWSTVELLGEGLGGPLFLWPVLFVFWWVWLRYTRWIGRCARDVVRGERARSAVDHLASLPVEPRADAHLDAVDRALLQETLALEAELSSGSADDIRERTQAWLDALGGVLPGRAAALAQAGLSRQHVEAALNDRVRDGRSLNRELCRFADGVSEHLSRPPSDGYR